MLYNLSMDQPNVDISINSTSVFQNVPPCSKSNPIVDLELAAKLYAVNGLTYEQIAKQLGVTKQAVHQRLQRFRDMLIPSEELEYWKNNRIMLKDTAELNLFLDMMDPQKRAAASLNNTAYAYRQIHETRRLDEGLSTVNVDLHAEFEDRRQLQSAKQALQNAIAGTTDSDNV